MIMLSADLLTSVKTHGLVPTSQTTFQDSDLLLLANEEMLTYIAPMLIRTHEEYYVTYDNIPLVASQSKYRIPERAIGSKLRDLSYIDTSGREVVLERIEPERIPEFSGMTGPIPRSFYIQGNYIILLPTLNAGAVGSLNAYYFSRPGQLVDATGFRAIQSLTTNSVTLSSIPNGFVNTAKYDIMSQLSGNELLARDLAVSSIVGNTITFTTNLPTTVGVNDYICLRLQSPVPQCPEELHPILVQRIVIRILEALNDTQGLQNALKTLSLMEKNALALIQSRVQGKPHKIVANNFRKRRFPLF